MKNFNQRVGLEGTGHSNITGPLSTSILAKMAQQQAATNGGTTAGSTTANSNTTIFSQASAPTSVALQKHINDLKSQKTQTNQQLTEAQQKRAKAEIDRQSCQRTKAVIKTWDNSCLDRNNALKGSLDREIADYQQRLIDLESQIKQAQVDYEAAVKSEAEAVKAQAEAHEKELLAQAAANPETAKIKAEAETAQANAHVEADKQKTMLYVGAGVVVLVILAVAAMFILKK